MKEEESCLGFSLRLHGRGRWLPDGEYKHGPQLSGLVFRDGFSLSASSFLFVFSTLCSTEHKLKSPSRGIDPGIHFLPVLFGFARAPAVTAEIPDRLSSQAN